MPSNRKLLILDLDETLVHASEVAVAATPNVRAIEKRGWRDRVSRATLPPAGTAR